MLQNISSISIYTLVFDKNYVYKAAPKTGVCSPCECEKFESVLFNLINVHNCQELQNLMIERSWKHGKSIEFSRNNIFAFKKIHRSKTFCAFFDFFSFWKWKYARNIGNSRILSRVSVIVVKYSVNQVDYITKWWRCFEQ